MKKTTLFLSIIVAAMAFFALPGRVSAADRPYIISQAAVVLEAETGAVLYEKNSGKKMYPASITKIMTAMLALEHCDINEVMTTSYNAVYSLPYNTSHIALFENEQITVEQALYALGIESANDASNVIAEHISGSNAEFGKLMTERAKQAGAEHTNFTNPHGLPDNNHYTTALDMALITADALKIDGIERYFSTNRFDMGPTNEREETRQFWNANYFINGYERCEGLVMSKTGWTEEARHTLVTAAKRDGRTLIAVVMYSEHQGEKYDDTMALLDYCFENYRTFEITKDSMLDFFPSTVSLWDGSEAKVEQDRFMVENFLVTAPEDCDEEDFSFSFGTGVLNRQKTIATVTVDVYYRQNGEKHLCGQQDVSVIVNSDKIQADRSKMINAVKRTVLIVFNLLLWTLVIWCSFIALRQVVIIENRRRNRKKRRQIMERRRKRRSDENVNRK